MHIYQSKRCQTPDTHVSDRYQESFYDQQTKQSLSEPYPLDWLHV